MRAVFIFLFTCASIVLSAQQTPAYQLMRKADSLNMRGFCSDALELARQSIRFLVQDGIKDTSTYANALATEAWAMYQLSNDDETDKQALKKGIEALDLRLNFHRTENHPDVADSYYFLGAVTGFMGNKDAIQLVQKGLDIYGNFRQPHDWDMVRGERFLAFQYVWGENRDKEKANYHIKKSLDAIQKNPNHEAWQLGRILQGAGDVYGVFNYDSSLIYYPLALRQFEIAGYINQHLWVQGCRSKLDVVKEKKRADVHLMNARNLMDMGQIEKAKPSLDSMFAYFRGYPDSSHRSYAYFLKGRWHLLRYDLKTAAAYLDTAIVLSEGFLKYDLTKADQYGDTPNNKSELKDSFNFNLNKSGDSYYLLSYYAMQSLAMKYLSKSDLAKIYRQSAIIHFERIKPFIDKHQMPEAIIRQVALMRENQGNPEGMIMLLHEVLKLSNDIGKDNYYKNAAYTKGETQYNAYTLLASIYQSIQIDSSLKYWLKALEVAKRTYEPLDYNIFTGDTYTSIAALYHQNKDYEKAIEYQYKALTCYERSESGEMNPQTASTLNTLATAIQLNCTANDNPYDKNNAKFSAMFDSIPLLLDRSIRGMQQATQQNKATRFHNIPLQNAYISLGAYYQTRYNFSNDPAYLKKARLYFDTAMQVFDNDPSFKLTVQTGDIDLRSNYAKAAVVHAQCYQVLKDRADAEKAFKYAELSKAALLRVGLQDRVGKYDNVPGALLDEEYTLRYKINRFAENRETDSLLKYTLQLEILLEKIQKDYPNYFAIKYDNSVPTITEVQKKYLDRDQTMVEYFEHGNIWYAFVIRQDTFDIFYLGSQNDLEDQTNLLIETMRQTCRKGKKSPGGKPDMPYPQLVRHYNEAAYELYTNFVEPLNSLMTTRVVVVPSGPLCRVPFQLLLSEKSQYSDRIPSDLAYLIKNYAFSYTYSAKLLDLMKSIPKPVGDREMLPFAAFGPAYINDSNPNLMPLPESMQNANAIAQAMNAPALTGDEATAQLFFNLAEHLRVLMFTGHGDASFTDGDSCRLYFTSKYTDKSGVKKQLKNLGIDNGDLKEIRQRYIMVRDLYSLQMDCDVAVLNACLSAQGQLDGLEGIVGLTRAFVYAGTRSVVSTLWEALDSQSSATILSFFKNLKAGIPKDLALQKAQLENISKGTPCSWGSFIVVGDTRPLKL